MDDRFERLKKKVLAFRDERDWKQFHSPKNLAEGLSVEAAELLERFLWIKEAESYDLPDKTRAHVAEEMADVLLFLIYLSEALDVDLFAETERKLQRNARKYPVDKARGRSTKYTDL